MQMNLHGKNPPEYYTLDVVVLRYVALRALPDLNGVSEYIAAG